MPIFFDDCAFGPIIDPFYGRQPDVVEGWYANGWTPSPGHSMVRDTSTWSKLEKFVTDVIKAHRTDPRILCWDLYNEPTNGGVGDVSIPLVEKVFQWARRLNPDQPLTCGYWNGNAKLNDVIFRNSDIITFHNYHPADELGDVIRTLQTLGRPMICTEWLNRGLQSDVETCLPVFFEENVGCMHWGLVNGKTQTDLNWGHQPDDPEPIVWQHDLFHSDFKPYSASEVNLFKSLMKASKSPQAARLSRGFRVQTIVPTSECIAQQWRYSTASPQGDWTAADYDDSKWQTGMGGFGARGTQGLSVGTEWRTNQIWLRKEFTVSSDRFTDLNLRVFHDEDIEVFINGERILHRAGWTMDYIWLPVSRNKLMALRSGRNVIAVRCTQSSGGQGVDVGLVDILDHGWSRRQAAGH
jgi:hypothetical protein